MSQSLDLGMVGNANIAALIDARAEVVWACLPHMDGDPVACTLLRERRGDADFGFFAVELVDFERSEQHYLANTAILVTRLYDRRGGAVEITDFAPRFLHHGRLFCPMTLVRQLRPVAGSPRLRVLLRPASQYGAKRPQLTYGSNHVRFVAENYVMRVTTDCSITALVDEIPFVLPGPVSFLLGPDETLQGGVHETARRFLEETTDYWHEWVRDLQIPFEWQEEIIRAALTLKLSAVDDTGALVGIVTHRELLRHLLPGFVQRSTTGSFRAPTKAEIARGSADPRDLPVRDVMSRSVLSVSEDQTLSDVATLMNSKDVDRFPVTRDGAVVGFLTRADLVRKLVSF